MCRFRWLLVVALVVAGCGNSSNESPTSDRQPVTVFAAASLTETFSDLAPEVSPTYNFAGSSALVAQIELGAPADVIATADMASMQKLLDAGLVEEPVVFAKNKLAILVQPGNPKRITSVTDLARSDIVLVIADDAVPAGKYAAQVFEAAGVAPRPRSKETDVKAAVARVVTGEADATVVYVTDVRAAGTKAEGITIPDDSNVVATYPIAIVRATSRHDAATKFIEFVVHGAGQDALRAHGFSSPA